MKEIYGGFMMWPHNLKDMISFEGSDPRILSGVFFMTKKCHRLAKTCDITTINQ